jgi:hypothetical protein
LIKEHRRTDNIVILVPSRALINQTVIKLKEEFKKEANKVNAGKFPNLTITEFAKI